MDNTPITTPPASGSVESDTELHTPPRATTTTHVEHATPTVPNNATGQNYVSDHIGRDENCQILSKEISGKILGPMPPSEFLNKFLPKSTDLGAAPAFDRTSLKSMMGATTEVGMYKPFVSDSILNISSSRLISWVSFF